MGVHAFSFLLAQPPIPLSLPVEEQPFPHVQSWWELLPPPSVRAQSPDHALPASHWQGNAPDSASVDQTPTPGR